MSSEKVDFKYVARVVGIIFAVILGMNFLAGFVDGVGGPDIDQDETGLNLPPRNDLRF